MPQAREETTAAFFLDWAGIEIKLFFVCVKLAARGGTGIPGRFWNSGRVYLHAQNCRLTFLIGHFFAPLLNKTAGRVELATYLELVYLSSQQGTPITIVL